MQKTEKGPLYFRVADLASSQNKKGLLPISSTTLWRWVKNGRFPPSVKLGPAITAWSAEEIHSWMEKANKGDRNV